jgi:hypothetical protein
MAEFLRQLGYADIFSFSKQFKQRTAATHRPRSEGEWKGENGELRMVVFCRL